MKILMVADTLIKGGRERRMLELIKELKKKNEIFEIYLISLTDVVEYRYVYDLPIKFEIIKRKYKKDFSIFPKLRRIIKTFKPDIIHSWGTMASVYIVSVNFFTGIPFINGVISSAPDNLNNFDKFYLRMRLTYPFSDAVVANSKAGLLSYRAPLKKSICIYNGINFKRFEQLKSCELVEQEILGRPKGNHFIAAMVGAFESRKDYDTLIEAAVKMCETNRQIIFILIGEGSGLQKIKEKVPPEMSEQILFPGSRNDIESILQIIDVGLLITPFEGISNSIIEYMASGKPVIATVGGGTAELVIDGVNGFLIEQKSPDAIIEKIETLINNPAFAKQLGENGMNWVHSSFEVSKNTEAYITLYKKLINNHKR